MAFEKMKWAFTTGTNLLYPDPSWPEVAEADASNQATVTTLPQKVGLTQENHPFFS